MASGPQRQRKLLKVGMLNILSGHICMYGEKLYSYGVTVKVGDALAPLAPPPSAAHGL